MFARILLVLLCVLATPAATLASAVCCAGNDACCSEPCAASDCATGAGSHCTLSATSTCEGTPSPAPTLLADAGVALAHHAVVSAALGTAATTPPPPGTPRFLRLRTLRI